jgi:hypothetical protein
MGANRITGLPQAASGTEPVIFDQLMLQFQANYGPYGFEIKIGDVPSSLEGYSSTNDFIKNVTYTPTSGSTGYYQVSVEPSKVF